jgi:hypothetical protein
LKHDAGTLSDAKEIIKGYTRDPDGVVTGPKDGVYSPTNIYDITGKTEIYKNNGKYYIFDEASGKKLSVPSPNVGTLSIKELRDMGKGFECGVLCELNLPSNTKMIETPMGDSTLRAIPDAIDGRTIIEVKNVEYLTNSDQLRAYLYNTDYENINLYVRSDTKISGKLYDALMRKEGSKIYTYDPITKTIGNWKP